VFCGARRCLGHGLSFAKTALAPANAARLVSAYRGGPGRVNGFSTRWRACFLEAPTVVVFGLSMTVVVMVFGIYIGLFGVFARS
jgi:hypothetical protein